MSSGKANIRQKGNSIYPEKRQVKDNDEKFPMVLMRDFVRKPDVPEVEVVEPLEGFDIFGILPKRRKRNFRQYE